MSQMSSKNDFEVILQSSQLDKLKDVSNQMVAELIQSPQLIKVHSDLENAAPVLKVRVDPIKAAAEGVVPASVGGLLNSMLSGLKASTMEVAGQEVDVKVEYPNDSYDTLDKVEGIMAALWRLQILLISVMKTVLPLSAGRTNNTWLPLQDPLPM